MHPTQIRMRCTLWVWPTAAPVAARPAPVALEPTISVVDKALAIAAMVVGLLAAGSVVYLAFLLPLE